MYFAQPQLINKPRGRQHGSKNKATESIRWGIVEAYRQLGGVDGLVKWGQANPSLFYPMLTRLLPHELAESGLAGNITVVIQRTPQAVLPTDKPLEISQADQGNDGRGVIPD
jgi:hypothetical protein